MDEKIVEANGLLFNVREAGPREGKLVLILHGFPEFSFSWEGIGAQIAAGGRRVWIPDQRGYNLSSKPPRIADYNSEILAKDIVSLIDSAGCSEADLVAHDWGGHVAWWAAARYPQRIRSLIIMNCAHPRVMFRNVLTNPRQTLKSWYVFALQMPAIPEWLLSRDHFSIMCRSLDWDGERGGMTDSEASRYVQAWAQPRALKSMINWYRAAARTRPFTLDEPRIRVPTLLIWGEKDRFLHPSLAQQSIEYCDDGKLVLIPHAGHWVNHERPSEVGRLIENFLI